jgi:CDP-diacylglycerol--serine O-phosphatidyltransferase
MLPRFVGRVGLADAVTVANAALGFVTTVLASQDLELAARLLLLAAIADGLDGVLARHHGSTDAGPFLDSLADVSSFAVAPAALVYAVLTSPPSRAPWVETVAITNPRYLLAVGVPALFVAMAVTRLGLYTAYDTDGEYTEGVPSTLAATIIGAAILAETGLRRPEFVLLVTLLFSYLMVTTIEYPDLLTRDALIMGVIHALAVLVPQTPLGRTFPVALLTLSLAYLMLGPWLYWRDGLPSITPNGNP